MGHYLLVLNKYKCGYICVSRGRELYNLCCKGVTVVSLYDARYNNSGVARFVA